MNDSAHNVSDPSALALPPTKAKRDRPNFSLVRQREEVIAEHESTIAGLNSDLSNLRALLESQHKTIKRNAVNLRRWIAGAFIGGACVGVAITTLAL